MNDPLCDRFSFSAKWKRAKWKRRIQGRRGGEGSQRRCWEESLCVWNDQDVGATGSGAAPSVGESWARWWWGCTDGLEPGSQLAPLYGPCSLITADECVWESECGGWGGGRGGWGMGGGGGHEQVTGRGEEPVADPRHHQAQRSRSLTAN